MAHEKKSENKLMSLSKSLPYDDVQCPKCNLLVGFATVNC